MSRNKKKKKQPQRQSAQLSPENYIRQKARNLPLDQCMITTEWESEGIANVMVPRVHKNGNKTIGFYLVDLKCLGIKETYYFFNISDSEWDDRVPASWDDDMVECDYALAHSIIVGGKKYAEQYGFKPHKNWAVTEYILEPDNENIPTADVEFGVDGMPYYVSGPYDDLPFINRVIKTLEKTAGPGHFHYIVHAGDPDLEDSLYSVNDDADDDVEYYDDEDEYYDDDDDDVDDEFVALKALEAFKMLTVFYTQSFPGEKPGIQPHEIVENAPINDEKYESEVTYDDYNYILYKIKDLQRKSKTSHKRGLEKLRDRFIDSPEGLWMTYLAYFGVFGSGPLEIGKFIDQKYPDIVGYILLKSHLASREGNPDKGWELLGKSLKIEEAFPDCESFTSVEFLGFLMASLSYFTAIGDIATAISYATVLVNQPVNEQGENYVFLEPFIDLLEKLKFILEEAEIPEISDHPDE